MAASVTGTPVELTSTSQSVTVPANAKAAVFTWSYWNASSGQGLASATLNGVAPDAAVESATGAGGADATATGIALFLAPATGSHTFAHAFDATQTEGPTRTLTFLTADGAIALRGSLQAANASGAGAASVSLTGLTAGDLALAHDQKFGASPANQSGWTSLATGSNNSEFWRVRSIAAAGTSVTASAQGPNYSSIAAGAFYDAGGTPSPALTDVDTDETVLDGQTGVAITGTDMGADETERTFTLRQGSTSVPQTETGSGTDTAATLTIGIEQSGADIKFGSATLRVTRTDDDAYGEIAITVNPPTGQLYVDIGTPDSEADNRITAVDDITSGDQLQARGEGGGAAPAGLNLEANGTFWFEDGETPAAFDVRVWDASDSTWGDWRTQSIAGGEIAGTTSITFTPQGSLHGRGALQGTSALSFASAATLIARLQASGSSSITFTPAGELAGKAPLSGLSTLAFSPLGSLLGKTSLQGASSLTFSPVGAISGRALRSGTSALSFAPDGAIRGVGKLSSSSGITFTPTGVLVGKASISGATVLTFTVEGTLNTPPGALRGSTGIEFTPAGSLRAIGHLAGVSGLSFSPSGLLTAKANLNGTSTLEFTCSGTLTEADLGAISGATSITFTPTGNLGAKLRLSGGTTLTFIAHGSLVRPSGYTIDGQSQVVIDSSYGALRLYANNVADFFTF